MATISVIESLIKRVFEAFEKELFAQATFCDLSKAFDCVDHPILLNKLRFYGMNNISHKLIESCLSNREQIVCVGKNKSELKLINLVYLRVRSNCLH